MGLLSPRRARTRAITAAVNAPTGRIARIVKGSMPANPMPSNAQPWQQDGWALYDTIGALKYVAMNRGNMYRRVRLYAAVKPDDDGDPIPCEDILDPSKTDIKPPAGFPADLVAQAIAELGRINSPIGGRAAIQYDMGVNITVAGDMWLAAEPDDFDGERWSIYSVTELRRQGNWPDGTPKWTSLGPPSRILTQGTVVFRLYNPHPNRHNLADSPTMGVLDDLEELALIRRSFRNVEKSHIVGAGLLLIPDELSFPPVDPEDPDGPDELDRDLEAQFTAPLANEQSAANVHPTVIRGPGEHLVPDRLRHITFDRPVDKQLQDRETKTLERFAIGMDTPPEIVLGLGDVNHWNGAVISEENWKAHGEPGMQLLASQLGTVVLRALLTSSSEGDGTATPRWKRNLIGRIVIGIDASQVVDHADQTDDAAKAHDSFVISDAAYRRYANFNDEDAPSADEVAKRVEIQRLIHARGAVPGDVPPGDVAGPGAPSPAAQQPQPTPEPASPVPAQSQPARTASAALTAAAGRPVGDRLADLDLALYNRVQTLCQAAVRRQLERAGARITSKAQRNKTVLAAARQAPKHAVAAALGRGVVASLGLADDELVGDYSDVLDDVDTQTDRSRAAGLAALLTFLKTHGQQPSDAQRTEYDARALQAKQNGRLQLGQALAGFTLAQLYQPTAAADVHGEGVAAGDLPPGIVRSALAVYGDQTLGTDGKPADGRPLQAVAAGALNLAFGAQLGLQVGLWMWVHGTPEHPFPPHEDLDGAIFDDGDPSDTRRDNTTDVWTGSGVFFPGDHEGCSCIAEYLVDYPQSSDYQAGDG